MPACTCTVFKCFYTLNSTSWASASFFVYNIKLIILYPMKDILGCSHFIIIVNTGAIITQLYCKFCWDTRVLLCHLTTMQVCGTSHTPSPGILSHCLSCHNMNPRSPTSAPNRETALVINVCPTGSLQDSSLPDKWLGEKSEKQERTSSESSENCLRIHI
ncbi:hypothetical protein HJG60_012104 [Phyllostomus discolor]|uniref:Uncharacterized protein n=1 Tax=Phyllostomus discolor TaxID=89673 RepID=A0A834DYR7_9CHIR|nr:hypothetical protein HJG60_012104 [Phyllostomus discolor]